MDSWNAIIPSTSSLIIFSSFLFLFSCYTYRYSTVVQQDTSVRLFSVQPLVQRDKVTRRNLSYTRSSSHSCPIFPKLLSASPMARQNEAQRILAFQELPKWITICASALLHRSALKKAMKDETRDGVLLNKNYYEGQKRIKRNLGLHWTATPDFGIK